MKYFVRIGETVHEIEVDGEQIVVAGTRREAHLVPIPGTPLRQLTLDGVAGSWVVQPLGRGSWSIAQGGVAHEVAVLDARTHHIQSQTATRSTGPASGSLRAPMPGLVARVAVAVGERVTAKQPLVVLEAMKMENQLDAPIAGVVDEVRVAPGDTVEKGAVLVTISADPPKA